CLSISNITSAPSERPIQLRCISFKLSGQSRSSKSSKRRSAYLVIFNIHCFIAFLTTGCPPRSLLPSRSEEHTSELQSRFDLVCRLLLAQRKRCSTCA